MFKHIIRYCLIVLVLVLAVHFGYQGINAMSPLFKGHCLATLVMIVMTWTVYAGITSPRARRWIFFWKRNSDKKFREESTFNPVVLMRLQLVVAFLSIALLFGYIAKLEVERNTMFTAGIGGVMNAGWMLSFGAPLFEVWDYLERLELTLLTADKVWLAIVVGVSPVLTLSTAATLFRLPKFWAMLLPLSRREVCIFSDLNERAQKYANVIRRDHPDNPPYIVFCSDGRVDLVDTAAIAGPCLVLKQSICSLLLPRYALRRISFYLVTDDDNLIIEHTIRLHEKYRRSGCRINCVSPAVLNEHVVDQLNSSVAKEVGKEQEEKENKKKKKEDKKAERKEKRAMKRAAKVAKRKGNGKTDQGDEACADERIPKEGSRTEKDGEQSNEMCKKPEPCIGFTEDGQINRHSRGYARMVQASFVDVINEAIRVVYNSFHVSTPPLINEELLKRIAPNGEELVLRALVLGAGSLGEEITRTLLWYCQLPGIRVQVTIAGKESEDEIRGRVYRRNLRFEEYLKEIGYADAAKLFVKPNVDLRTEELERLLEGEISAFPSSEYHFIFVATGDDNQNYQLALRVRRYYLRHPMSWGYPDVRAVIWDDTVTNVIQKEDIQALNGVTGAGDPRRHTDYALLFEEKPPQLYHRTCPVTLMGAMEETFDRLHRLEYDALRYHAQYSGVSAENMQDRGIPRSVYYAYYASSESDKRSNWAVAIHGRAKAEWDRWMEQRNLDEICRLAALAECEHVTVPSVSALRDTRLAALTECEHVTVPSVSALRDTRLAALTECEHVRWCIFKLLEGDCPVPEDKLDAFLSGNLKGRDEDVIRGYHATLRMWTNLLRRSEENVGNSDFWLKMIESNKKLAKFSIEINKRKVWR